MADLQSSLRRGGIVCAGSLASASSLLAGLFPIDLPAGHTSRRQMLSNPPSPRGIAADGPTNKNWAHGPVRNQCKFDRYFVCSIIASVTSRPVWRGIIKSVRSKPCPGASDRYRSYVFCDKYGERESTQRLCRPTPFHSRGQSLAPNSRR